MIRIAIYCFGWILPEWITFCCCCSLIWLKLALFRTKKERLICTFLTDLLPQNRHKGFFSTSLWHLKMMKFEIKWCLVCITEILCGLDSYWMDKCWSCHWCSRRRCFAFVAQRQDVFLQVYDPPLLNRLRSMKNFFTEPEQQHREGDMILTALHEVHQFLDNVI